MKRNVYAILAAILVLAVITAACGNRGEKGNATGGEGKPLEMKVGLLKLTSSAPLFIAMDKGFFEQEGLKVTPEWFDAAQPIAVATAGGTVDVGATGITASLYNMVAGGQKMLIVADKGREEKGYSLSALLVHKDSSIASVKDLKGKKIGITQTGSTFHYMAGRLLEKYGLSLADVELVPLGTVSAMMETLRSKTVDAVLLNEPNTTTVVKEGYGKVIASIGDEFSYQNAGLFFSQKFANNRDAAVRFLKAYVKATRYYYDAVLVQKDGKLVPGKNYDEVVKIIAKYTGQPEEHIKLGFTYMDRDGKLLAEDIQTQIDWYYKNKMIEKAIDAKTIVNTELLDEAVKALGK